MRASKLGILIWLRNLFTSTTGDCFCYKDYMFAFTLAQRCLQQPSNINTLGAAGFKLIDYIFIIGGNIRRRDLDLSNIVERARARVSLCPTNVPYTVLGHRINYTYLLIDYI